MFCVLCLCFMFYVLCAMCFCVYGVVTGVYGFVFCVLWMGFYPEVFLEPMHTSVANLVQHGQWRG